MGKDHKISLLNVQEILKDTSTNIQLASKLCVHSLIHNSSASIIIEREWI